MLETCGIFEGTLDKYDFLLELPPPWVGFDLMSGFFFYTRCH